MGGVGSAVWVRMVPFLTDNKFDHFLSGEDILPSVLHLRARGVPTLKSKITEFLRIQVRVHHPGEL